MEKDNDSISVMCTDVVLPEKLKENTLVMEEVSAATVPSTVSVSPQASISAEGASSTTRPMKRKKHHNSSLKTRTTTVDIQEEFVEMEREKEKQLQEYRSKKIKLYERMFSQQEEMLQLQRRSTLALESLVTKLSGNYSTESPFSVSPIIKFSDLS
ncbi:uncharacterized protein LOC134276930 [Saccostrea cucullata]|uniref:uncharacterized protein LOC134276930 n=1 Tax=Saccostrea cuccullata TaxID=36930 RepID=UPI002ED18E98